MWVKPAGFIIRWYVFHKYTKQNLQEKRLTKIVIVVAAKKEFSLMIAGILKIVSSSIPVVQYLY